MSYCSELTCFQLPCHVHAEGKQSAPVTLQLANGVNMPVLGFGCAFGNWTDRSQFFGFQPDLAWAAIPAAFRAGFRHFDAAFIYGSHNILGASLGAEFARGSVKREDVFVTTKVFHPHAEIALNRLGRSFDFSLDLSQVKERILLDVEKSLNELNLGRVDLLLMHWPGNHNTTDEARGRALRREVWAAFEEVYRSGRARAIGVSNFLVRHLEGLKEDGAAVTPMVNQIEVNPYITQEATVAYCQANGIHVSAWAPFGSGDSSLLSDPLLVSLSVKYGKNIGQIILRWLFQRGMSSLPKSSNEGRMRSNLQIFDFIIEEQDIQAISGLNKHKTSVVTSESIA
jgi:diketogulonate reductase-like aldo/keto reductase